MLGLSTEALLSAWERGRAEPLLVGRSLALLGAATPDSAETSLAELSIGERDALLLQLYEELFGTQVGALAICSGCGERVELSFDVSEVRIPHREKPNNKLTVSWKQYRVEFRLPTSRDLLVLGGPDDIETKRLLLLERIVFQAECAGEAIAAKGLPEDVISAMESEMESADPQGEVNLKLRCQSCGHEWSARFDAGSFLWTNVDAWAIRLLREVHQLARAYGWRERDIITMSPWRRNTYLEMLGA